MVIVGQEKLLSKLNKLSYSEFPQTNLIVGEEGSGRRTVCNYLAEKFCLEIMDISDNLTFEYLTSVEVLSFPHLFIVDLSNSSNKEQNAILKFTEEPPEGSIIFLLCEDTSGVIDTVMNRCSVWYMEKYTAEQLKTFTSNEKVLSIFKTPGKLIKVSSLENLDEYENTAKKVVEKMFSANYVNCLKLTNLFISGKDKAEPRLNLGIFLELAKNYVLCYIKSTGDNSRFSMYSKFLQLEKDIKNRSYNKKFLLDKLWYDIKFGG